MGVLNAFHIQPLGLLPKMLCDILLNWPPLEVCTIVLPLVLLSDAVLHLLTVPSALPGPSLAPLVISHGFLALQISLPRQGVFRTPSTLSDGAPLAQSPRPSSFPPLQRRPSRPWPARRPPPHQRLHLRVRGGHLEPVDLLHHGAGEREGQGPGAARDADGTARGGGPRSPADDAD